MFLGRGFSHDTHEFGVSWRRACPVEAWRPPATAVFHSKATFFTAIASVWDCASRGGKRLLQSCPLEPRRKCRKENASLPRGDGSGRQLGIAMDSPPLPQPSSRPPARYAPQAKGVCCHTIPAPPASLCLPLVTRRPAASRFLEQPCPDLLPRDDIGGILLMTRNAVIQLSALSGRQRKRVSFQALPDCIEQVCLLSDGEAIYLC